MDELVGLMSREKLELERLLFRVTTLRHHLVAGEARFLNWAAEDVETASRHVREAELRRAIVLDGLAAQWGVPAAELTPAAIEERAPEPYRTILADVHRDMKRHMDELNGLVQTTQQLAANGVASVKDLLARLSGLPQPAAGASTTDSPRLYGPAAYPTDPLPRYDRAL